MFIPALLLAAQEFVVTASRVPEEIENTAASAAVIDARTIERLGDPLAPALVRLTPSASVETGGPAGTLSQVRIRGAEANHTLLFIDGIRANDPAAGDIPRFELLNADIISRIEVVRGPQSALWGSDAIGGVVAVNGIEQQRQGYASSVEGGSFGFRRLGASGAVSTDMMSLAAAAGWQRASGIDSFAGDGDRDGYRNVSGRFRGSLAVRPGFELGASGFSLAGRSEFDGFNPAPPFQRTDTLDSTSNRMSAGRVWLSGGNQERGISGTIAASLLGSSNRNFLVEEEINRTRGVRRAVNGQLNYRFATGTANHVAAIALEHGRERFRARDTLYFGASNQDRGRFHSAVTAEWRAEFEQVVADVAVRHDRFSAFDDATSLRASALVRVGGGFSVAGSYAEGIAQPTFFDLYGFFPGSFAGNPDLRPESSRGFEASIRYRGASVEAALTGYMQKLRDEIVDMFDPATFLSSTVNRASSSRRSGVEAELAWSPSPAFRLSANYAYLRASEPGAAPSLQLREIRRPRHSGSVAIDGRRGRLTYGASLAFAGSRMDTNFDVFPAQRVRLGAYWLAGGRVAYEVRPGLEIFGRASNLLDQRYQDVFGYRTEGRGVYAGVRLSGE